MKQPSMKRSNNHDFTLIGCSDRRSPLRFHVLGPERGLGPQARGRLRGSGLEVRGARMCSWGAMENMLVNDGGTITSDLVN